MARLSGQTIRAEKAFYLFRVFPVIGSAEQQIRMVPVWGDGGPSVNGYKLLQTASWPGLDTT